MRCADYSNLLQFILDFWLPAVTADRTIERTDKPLHITKRIGSTTYKVSVHFSRTSRETMSDKLVRLIERDAVKQ